MPITANQRAAAQAVQDAASHDLTPTIRLVAGPGTGKSFVIEGRVHWLLSNQNINPDAIIAVSFTRAATKDLQERIYSFCNSRGQTNVANVKVKTLHALALYLLRRTGHLVAYPTDPMIMDDWEMSAIFDAEFGITINQNSTRCDEIRRDHEAFWSTGTWGPANLIIQNPITPAERNAFNTFFRPRTQTYSCVLPGELVRMCVDQIRAGNIDPVAQLGVEHLIVDEVQDLNPCDFDFIDTLINRGVNVFICGDDDQSVYSFRYAFPQGIQRFTHQYPGSANHVLNDCFRCTTHVLSAAQGVINNNVFPNRIPKNLASLHTNANPANYGFVQGNIFNSHGVEANYIARSCNDLINSGVPANEIMILLSNRRLQLSAITTSLDNAGVPYDANLRDDFKDANYGRFLMALLRIKENDQDYVAHRVLLGVPSGVGVGICNGIAEQILTSGLNFRNLFYNQLPNGVFNSRQISAISRAQTNIAAIQGWNLTDTVAQHLTSITQLITNNFRAIDATNFNSFINSLPGAMTLEELKDFLETDSEETKDRIQTEISNRQNIQQQTPNPPALKVKIMTFHSSKGLSGKVVFIPGLEERVFPSARAAQFPASVLECARLLYVAVTRAKVACILSYSRNRSIYGNRQSMAASRFCADTGITFVQQNNNSLTQAQIQTINNSIANF